MALTTHPDSGIFPQKLRQARLELHMTVIEAAKKIGVSKATYSRWERPRGNEGALTPMRKYHEAITAAMSEELPTHLQDDTIRQEVLATIARLKSLSGAKEVRMFF
jgi:transcriptional regulator with XRE-family HTH domain